MTNRSFTGEDCYLNYKPSYSTITWLLIYIQKIVIIKVIIIKGKEHGWMN